ncbi:MAG: hypothetical protein KJZ85_07960 [Rhodobacteraceae bacterium]|nr:hypothetical protein [Paracoccaceae bacterium]
MRWILPVLAVAAAAACAQRVPDSASGVGFESYSDYMRARQAALARPSAATAPPAAPAAPPAVTGEPLSALRADGGAPAAAAGAAAAPAAGQASPAPAPARPAEPPRVRGDAPSTINPHLGEGEAYVSPSISDEQDFDAVAARESIESDRERLERLRQQYVVVEPTAVPERPGAAPNIVDYALATRHGVGQKRHDRSVFATEAGHRRACARFPSADLAQEEFLRRGGPGRDPENLDPDGDGFACDWDPAPFRLAVGRAGG